MQTQKERSYSITALQLHLDKDLLSIALVDSYISCIIVELQQIEWIIIVSMSLVHIALSNPNLYSRLEDGLPNISEL